MDIFRRHPGNPILEPSGLWWEAKGVLNPGAMVMDEKTVLIYRAVGTDGISRFGRAVSVDGKCFAREDVPVHEAGIRDWEARLGIEDPRITFLDSCYYVTLIKAATEPAHHPALAWETAPFRIRAWIARTADLRIFDELGPVRHDSNIKDLVLFPEKFDGRYAALIREYPSIQLITSEDLEEWSRPAPVIHPRPGTWEAERVGAGPPPVRVPGGWLVLYHANEYLRFPGNRRLYRMGLALLDGDDPSRVVYRHPEPIFEPTAPYEREGPVGQVVFGTGLIDRGEEIDLYYGAADGVIGLATARKEELLGLLP